MIAAQDEIARLKEAIDENDLAGVKALMTQNPELHRAPLGYGKDGPLTWVAECRIPRQSPGETRLAMAAWMMENGSDVHQGGDGPLMRAALGERIPMMDLLVRHGANVNARWHGHYPIVFAPCETLNPQALQWLLEHGADPHCGSLDYAIGTYVRSPEDLKACIKLIMNAGGKGRYSDLRWVMAVLLGQNDLLAELIKADAELVNRRFGELDFGATGGRMLTLRGATLLHLAAEYGNIEALQILLDGGADVNARAMVFEAAVGGQTAIFHAATQLDDFGLIATRMLLDRGAKLDLRAKLPGHYERPEDILDCTPLEYATLFPGSESETVRLLRKSSNVA